MVIEHEELAAYFDGWYGDMAVCPAKDEIQQRHLGLPPELLSTSLLTWSGIGEVERALELTPTAVLVDLACGRGGYGLELATRSGARLIGVDFSTAAIDAARAAAAPLGTAADFLVRDMVDTGLSSECADALIVVDAIQFPSNPMDAYREIFRLLRPGGRVVLTGWEPSGLNDAALPERIRQVDMRRGLETAGFVEVTDRDRLDWREAERRMWTEATSLEPGDDPAMRSFHDEGVRALANFDGYRRVMASARKPM